MTMIMIIIYDNDIIIIIITECLKKTFKILSMLSLRPHDHPVN